MGPTSSGDSSGQAGSDNSPVVVGTGNEDKLLFKPGPEAAPGLESRPGRGFGETPKGGGGRAPRGRCSPGGCLLAAAPFVPPCSVEETPTNWGRRLRSRPESNYRSSWFRSRACRGRGAVARRLAPFAPLQRGEENRHFPWTPPPAATLARAGVHSRGS